MATTTSNLGLIEPAGQDRALVANINTNSEKIDAEAGKVRDNFALVQNGDTATQAISKDQLVVWKGVLKKATANIANGATLSGSNLSDDTIAAELAALNSKIAKAVNNKTDFVFPGYASDVHDGNNEYIVQHNGIAVFTIIFDNNNYSQIAIILNNNYLTAENQMISSNGISLENHIRYLTIPVFAGDVIKSGYYSTYGVKELKMRLLYGS